MSDVNRISGAEDAQFVDKPTTAAIPPNVPLPGMAPGDERFLKPIPPPVWPSMEMPLPPEVSGAAQAGDNGKLKPHPDCEGVVEMMPDGPNPNVPPPPPGVSRILIGIPMLDVKYEFFESFLRFWTQLSMIPHPEFEVGYHVAYRKPVHMAEEYLVRVAINNRCTHILLMDDDIYDVTLEDLQKLLKADKDCIGGVMHASKFPHAMCVFRRYDLSKRVVDMPADVSMFRLYEVPCVCPKCSTGLSHWDIKHCPGCGEVQNQLIQEADLIPFAFTLIKLSVFDKIKKPWFHCTNGYPTDSWFGDRILEAGMHEYAHMGVRLNHAGITDATKPHFMQMGMVKAQQAKGVVVLTPEQMDMHQTLLFNKMKETENALKTRPEFVRDGKIAAPRGAAEGMTLITHGT